MTLVDTRSRNRLYWLPGIALTVLILSGCGLRSAPAYDSPGPRSNATRAQLEANLAELQAMQNTRMRRGSSDQISQEISLIQTRLTDGDFSVGDRIDLRVEGEAELSDTYVVEPGQILTLPIIGEIPLRGVLRSEFRDHMRNELSQYIRDPVVHSRPLIRVAVFGGVGSPGYYMVSPDALVTDVLMEAGGPRGNARMDRLRIDRRSQDIWSGEPLQVAVAEGRTLDQLSVRAGDQIHLPDRGRMGFREWVGIAGAVSSLVWLGIRITDRIN